MKTSKLTGAALDWAVAKAIGEYKPVAVLNYSTDWTHGGPIIEHEGIALRRWLETGWEADLWNFKFCEGHTNGTTALIAAMRCYVASKLGDNVDIPEGLKS